MAVFTVKVELTEPLAAGVTEVGERVQVAPAGQPETERLTEELKPLTEVIAAVYVLPAESVLAIFWEEGEAARVKSLRLNVAVTLFVAFIVTTQFDGVGDVVQDAGTSPDQLVKVEPVEAVAVKVTVVPEL